MPSGLSSVFFLRCFEFVAASFFVILMIHDLRVNCNTFTSQRKTYRQYLIHIDIFPVMCYDFFYTIPIGKWEQIEMELNII